jgi:anti-sigma factor RsiW
MMRSSCPNETDLNVLLKGELPDAERNRLEQHLEECAACRQRLDRMATGDDTWLGKARAYANSPAPVHAKQVAARFKSAKTKAGISSA